MLGQRHNSYIDCGSSSTPYNHVYKFEVRALLVLLYSVHTSKATLNAQLNCMLTLSKSYKYPVCDAIVLQSTCDRVQVCIRAYVCA